MGGVGSACPVAALIGTVGGNGRHRGLEAARVEIDVERHRTAARRGCSTAQHSTARTLGTDGPMGSSLAARRSKEGCRAVARMGVDLACDGAGVVTGADTGRGTGEGVRPCEEGWLWELATVRWQSMKTEVVEGSSQGRGGWKTPAVTSAQTDSKGRPRAMESGVEKSSAACTTVEVARSVVDSGEVGGAGTAGEAGAWTVARWSSAVHGPGRMGGWWVPGRRRRRCRRHRRRRLGHGRGGRPAVDLASRRWWRAGGGGRGRLTEGGPEAVEVAMPSGRLAVGSTGGEGWWRRLYLVEVGVGRGGCELGRRVVCWVIW